MSFAEARRLMRLVNVEACESMGVARSAAFVQVLDEAGVLLFRDKVYFHPDKVEVSLNQQHLCREAKIGPKAHKLRSVLVVMGILGFGFKTHAPIRS